MICFLQFFFIIHYKTFFTVKLLIAYVYGTVFVTFFITRMSSNQCGNILFAKMFLYSDILTWSSTLNLGPFLFLFIKVNICTWLYIKWLNLMVLWYLLLYLLTVSSNLSIYTFFDIEVIFINLVLEGANKSFSNIRFPFIMCWIHFYSIFF